MQALLWLLLPLAAASGWWMAQYSEAKKRKRSRAMLNSAYGQGLSYLLNEQSDKATEVLIQMVAVDPDTVELAGAGVEVRGKSNKYMAHEEDVDGDELVDLVVQVATENLDPGSFQDGYAAHG